MKRCNDTVGPIFALAVVCGTFLAIEREALLPSIANWLDVGQSPGRVDYVVELPGDVDRRPFVVGALLNAGFARAALIPQTADSPEEAAGILPRNTDVSRAVLRDRGVCDEQIVVLSGASEHTAGDLEILRDFLASRPNVSLAVVTSACHTRRARWAFRRMLGPDVAGRTIFISAPNPEFQASNWWKTPMGVEWIVSEYVKLTAYWFVYGKGLHWTAAIVAVAAFFTWRRRAKKVEGRKRLMVGG